MPMLIIADDERVPLYAAYTSDATLPHHAIMPSFEATIYHFINLLPIMLID